MAMPADADAEKIVILNGALSVSLIKFICAYFTSESLAPLPKKAREERQALMH